jgi:hypothetical protein
LTWSVFRNVGASDVCRQFTHQVMPESESGFCGRGTEPAQSESNCQRIRTSEVPESNPLRCCQPECLRARHSCGGPGTASPFDDELAGALGGPPAGSSAVEVRVYGSPSRPIMLETIRWTRKNPSQLGPRAGAWGGVERFPSCPTAHVRCTVASSKATVPRNSTVTSTAKRSCLIPSQVIATGSAMAAGRMAARLGL